MTDQEDPPAIQPLDDLLRRLKATQPQPPSPRTPAQESLLRQMIEASESLTPRPRR